MSRMRTSYNAVNKTAQRPSKVRFLGCYHNDHPDRRNGIETLVFPGAREVRSVLRLQ